MVKCKNCAHFISTIKTQGCGLNYPVAKCSGNLEIECEDFITPADEEARQERVFEIQSKWEKRASRGICCKNL